MLEMLEAIDHARKLLAWPTAAQSCSIEGLHVAGPSQVVNSDFELVGAPLCAAVTDESRVCQVTGKFNSGLGACCRAPEVE
jgi:hypothetical protein